MEHKHFSHDHTLTLFKVPEGQNFQCKGCKLPCNGSIFACFTCQFFLHDHCANANRYIKHPSHVPHPLILMPSPTYCSGSFLCNACGAPGSSFSYSCALCEHDLHLNCAYLPQNVSHNAHQHALCLSFGSPGSPNCVEYCKICRKEVEVKRWSYVCERPECGFRVHAFCGSSEVKAGAYQDDRQEDNYFTPAVQNDRQEDNYYPPAVKNDRQEDNYYPPAVQNDGARVDLDQSHVRTDLTPEQEMMLEMGRMNLELQMANNLAFIMYNGRFN